MIKKFSTLICTLLMLITSLMACSNSIAYAEDTVEEPFLTITKAQVYHSSGQIYIATEYVFDTNKSYTYDAIDGKRTVKYSDIIYSLKAYLDTNKDRLKVEYIYDNYLPFVITVIDKKYYSRTEMNHDLGITGDEISEPLPKESDFWYSSYINTSKTYLAGGGKASIINSIKLFLISAMQASNPIIDESRLKFNYCYGTELKSITSSGKLLESTNDNMYYHMFYDINEDTVITLKQKVPNTANWYGVIIGSSLGAIAIGVIIYFVVKRKARRNNE